MSKTRIAVAGAGYIGQAHMGVARASAGCALSAVVDPSPAAQAVARQADVPLYPSIEALLASEHRPDGLVLDTAACPRSWQQTLQENKAYPSCADEDCYVITGTDGSLSVPTMRLKTYPRAEDRSWWKPFEVGTVGLVHDDPLQRQMDHFGAVVRGEIPPLVSARDGLDNLRVTEAIAEAATTGRVVELA